MKKNVLGWELLLFICGIILVLMSLFIKTLTYYPSILGMGCVIIGASIGGLYKKNRLLKSENKTNKTRHEEQLKNAKINLDDERKIMLRQKSGQITNTIMFIVLFILIIAFTSIGVENWIIFILWV